jgi:hypothetical protein
MDRPISLQLLLGAVAWSPEVGSEQSLVLSSTESLPSDGWPAQQRYPRWAVASGIRQGAIHLWPTSRPSFAELDSRGAQRVGLGRPFRRLVGSVAEPAGQLSRPDSHDD